MYSPVFTPKVQLQHFMILKKLIQKKDQHFNWTLT